MLLLPSSSLPLRCAAWLAALVFAGAAHGVVIDSGNGTGNTTAPADDFGFENVGVTDTGLSGVYLGDGWVLTANHVGARPITLLGVTYQVVIGSGVQLADPSNPTNPPPDLYVYRINGYPLLPAIVLSSATPAIGEVVSCLGYGWTREATQTTWSATWQESPPSPLVVYRGYKSIFNATRRWGTNAVTAVGGDVLDTRSIELSFDQFGGTTHESQAVVGDSGGGCFAKRGSTWELVGMMFANLTYGDGPGPQPDQPRNTAVFGNAAVLADIAYYRHADRRAHAARPGRSPRCPRPAPPHSRR